MFSFISFRVNGNISPIAEANVYNDPLAADLCFSNFKCTICPLDVTTRTAITEARFLSFLLNLISFVPSGISERAGSRQPFLWGIC